MIVWPTPAGGLKLQNAHFLSGIRQLTWTDVSISGPLNYFHQTPDFGHLLIDLPNTISILAVPKGDSDICGHDCQFSGSM